MYDPAVRQWGLLLEKHAQSPYAREAGELILDSFNKSKDYQNIEVWGRRLLQAPSFAEPKAQARLSTLIVQAIFKQGERESAEGQHVSAAEAYLRAAREFPRDERAAQAAVNAAVCAERAVDAGLARQAADLLAQSYGDRPEAARGVWIAATLHQSLGLLGEAAQYYETLADTLAEGRAPQGRALQRRASVHDARSARAGHRDRRELSAALPGRPLTDEVTFLMGKAHEQAEDWRSAAGAVRALLGFGEAAESPHRGARAAGRRPCRAGR